MPFDDAYNSRAAIAFNQVIGYVKAMEISELDPASKVELMTNYIFSLENKLKGIG